eukprot:CAMPEP_0183712180 /NCGR_PEP_ID=MMETSP0737-20130205/7385_1 /TAXON_ID=385413 /ORGANISM="Thalassiosira miniscula, Strain CCMP1093" /LENGTH=414 /DNA_ID=CAMNT_0025940759 /DNA_START=99 /DNA_END=1339 /DNA_ORIENTATION=+
MASISATFRAKTNFMKTWRPRSPPSNRDRLELYALHKQSISGDAPIDNDNLVMSVAEKAKLSAWRTKRGMSREEAMSRYGEECDRQLRVYGTAVAPGTAAAQGGGAGGTPAGTYSAPSRMQHTGKQTQQQQQQQRSYPQQSQQQQHSQQAAASTSEQTTGTGSTTPSTPQNTPANNNNEEEEEGRGVLLCPRGLAAIPLLCAAASESRSAYLARLQVTHPTNGWWAKQEPLCLEINNPLSLPEKLVLCLATQVEQLSLIVSEYMGEGHAVSIMSPSRLPGIFVAGPQRIPLLLDRLDINDNLSGEHGDHVSNTAVRRQAYQRSVGTAVRGGDPSERAGRGESLRGASGHWRAGGGVGVDAAHDALRRGHVGGGKGGHACGKFGLCDHGSLRLVVLAVGVAVVGIVWRVLGRYEW